MIDESRWINMSHGLELEPDINIGKRGNENGILFLAEYYLLKSMHGTLTEDDLATFSLITQNLQTYSLSGEQIQGLYDRGAHESHVGHEWYVKPEERRTISHDNLTAISCFSMANDLPFKRHIGKMAVKSLMRFDNTHPDSMTFTNFQMHPRDWFTWLFNAGGLYRLASYLFWPIFLLAGLEDIYNPMKCRPIWYERLWAKIRGKDIGEKRCFLDTSGPWLWFVRYESMYKKSWLVRAQRWFAYKTKFGYKRTFGENIMKSISEIYFGHPDHPIRELAKDIKFE